MPVWSTLARGLVFLCGDVAENGGVAKGDVYQLEASGGVFADFDFLRLGLIFGKLFIINCRESCCGETRQCVCNNVGLTLDVTGVGGKL